MAGPRIGVHSAESSEHEHAVACVVAAFITDPMEKWNPDEPHWHLAMIGVEPHAQGRGLGGALLRHALARCDREQAIAYLESSNPRNITLYERHGFERMGEIQVGAAPVVTPMLRRPR